MVDICDHVISSSHFGCHDASFSDQWESLVVRDFLMKQFESSPKHTEIILAPRPLFRFVLFSHFLMFTFGPFKEPSSALTVHFYERKTTAHFSPGRKNRRAIITKKERLVTKWRSSACLKSKQMVIIVYFFPFSLYL